jgi:hypothetical protein
MIVCANEAELLLGYYEKFREYVQGMGQLLQNVLLNLVVTGSHVGHKIAHQAAVRVGARHPPTVVLIAKEKHTIAPRRKEQCSQDRSKYGGG